METPRRVVRGLYLALVFLFWFAVLTVLLLIRLILHTSKMSLWAEDFVWYVQEINNAIMRIAAALSRS